MLDVVRISLTRAWSNLLRLFVDDFAPQKIRRELIRLIELQASRYTEMT